MTATIRKTTLTLKARGWCLWHHSREAGLEVWQVLGLVIEMEY